MRHLTVKPAHALAVTAVVAATAWGGASVASGADAGKPSLEPAPSARVAARAGAELVYPHSTFTVTAGTASSGTAKCPSGYKVVGGGVRSTHSDDFVNETGPYDGPDANSVPDNGWLVYMRNTQAGDTSATVYAVCKKN